MGAIVGGIIGGVKGAITGVLIGAGGTIAATEGKDVKIPEGTVLRIRLDEPTWVGTLAVARAEGRRTLPALARLR